MRAVPHSFSAVLQVLVVLLTIYSLVSATAQAKAQVATLIAADGRKLELFGVKSPDLRLQHFDNATVSATVSGIWIVYDDYNYSGESQLLTDKYAGFNILNTSLTSKVSSIRYAGNALEYLKSTLTLYQGTGYQGEEAIITGNQSYLDWKPLSFVAMGQESWTVFGAYNFSESFGSVCIFPPAFYETRQLVHFNDSIRSVLQGCAQMS